MLIKNGNKQEANTKMDTTYTTEIQKLNTKRVKKQVIAIGYIMYNILL